jgi:hypothetical protein
VKRAAPILMASLATGLFATAAPAGAARVHAAQGVGCEVENVPYRSTGTLVKAILTRDVGRGRYDGTVAVKVRHASRRAPRGRQSFVLNDTPVTFGKGVRKGLPDPGDRVRPAAGLPARRLHAVRRRRSGAIHRSEGATAAPPDEAPHTALTRSRAQVGPLPGISIGQRPT